MAIDARKTGEKWARVTPMRVDDYKDGVANPKKDWATETAAAEARYKEGVTKAAAEGRFGKGVREAGTEKWKEGATVKGPGRFQEGVAVGKDAYIEGFSPYADIINAVKFSPRYPKGDPRNLKRVEDVALALYRKRVGMAK